MRMFLPFFKTALPVFSALCLIFPSVSFAAPDNTLVTNGLVKEIRDFLESEIVMLSIKNQNEQYGSLSQAEIDELDKQWRAETESKSQPLISVILSNPLSSYLTRVQAHSMGQYVEIFVMDKNGLNVGQSAVSSDFWQGDEDKFQKTFGVGPDAVFLDEPEFNEDLKIWTSQINFALKDKTGAAVGAATVDLNLSELARRNSFASQNVPNSVN
jgi:hypothetical protein